jgi:hypothetical protein
MITKQELETVQSLIEIALRHESERLRNLTLAETSVQGSVMHIARSNTAKLVLAKLKKFVDEKPTIAVAIQGGFCMGSVSEIPATILVVDYDVDARDERRSWIPQDGGEFALAAVSEFSAEVDSTRISDIRDATVGAAA